MPILTIILLIINLALGAFVVLKLTSAKKDEERLERLIREEAAQNRQELSKNFESFTKQFILSTQGSEQKLDKIRDTVDANLKSIQQDSSTKLERCAKRLMRNCMRR